MPTLRKSTTQKLKIKLKIRKSITIRNTDTSDQMRVITTCVVVRHRHDK
jgi:hypothetical protein